MTDTIVSFKTAKLAKEKGFDLETPYFYTKPHSKMFGIDEKGRAHHIKNTAKKIYRCGEEVTLNIENVYSAPTQSLLQKWLREVHDINITILICGADHHQYVLHNKGREYIKTVDNPITYENHKNNWEDTLEKGLQEALKLIEYGRAIDKF